MSDMSGFSRQVFAVSTLHAGLSVKDLLMTLLVTQEQAAALTCSRCLLLMLLPLLLVQVHWLALCSAGMRLRLFSSRVLSLHLNALV
jgi:hypothetical protein